MPPLHSLLVPMFKQPRYVLYLNNVAPYSSGCTFVLCTMVLRSVRMCVCVWCADSLQGAAGKGPPRPQAQQDPLQLLQCGCAPKGQRVLSRAHPDRSQQKGGSEGGAERGGGGRVYCWLAMLPVIVDHKCSKQQQQHHPCYRSLQIPEAREIATQTA